MRCVVFLVLVIYSLFLYAASESPDPVEQRIQPIGKVHIQEQNKPLDTVVEPVKKEEPGKKTYERYCVVCHQEGLVGAPKFRDHAWKSRLADKRIEDLVASAIRGFNAMPAKGTCYGCSEEDIKAAVEYMLPDHD